MFKIPFICLFVLVARLEGFKLVTKWSNERPFWKKCKEKREKEVRLEWGH